MIISQVNSHLKKISIFTGKSQFLHVNILEASFPHLMSADTSPIKTTTLDYNNTTTTSQKLLLYSQLQYPYIEHQLQQQQQQNKQDT